MYFLNLNYQAGITLQYRRNIATDFFLLKNAANIMSMGT